MEDEQRKRVTVARSVTVDGDGGKPAYELKLDGDAVTIEQKDVFRLTPPAVALADLEEALRVLRGGG